MRNTYKYAKLYSGGEPQFIEGDLFRTIIPLKPVATAKVGPGVSDYDSDQVNDHDIAAKILSFCNIPRTKKEICEHFGYSNLTYFTRSYLTPLIESGKIKMTIPDKPKSRNQKYIKA